jgi:hypothetical protein
MKELIFGELKSILEKAAYSGLDLKLSAESQTQDNDSVSFTVKLSLDSKEEKADIEPVENPYTVTNLEAIENVLNPRNYSFHFIESICPHFIQHVSLITKFTALKERYEFDAEHPKYIGDDYKARVSLRELSEGVKVASNSLHKAFPSLNDLSIVINLAREYQVRHDKLKEDLNKETNKKLDDLKHSYICAIK